MCAALPKIRGLGLERNGPFWAAYARDVGSRDRGLSCERRDRTSSGPRYQRIRPRSTSESVPVGASRSPFQKSRIAFRGPSLTRSAAKCLALAILNKSVTLVQFVL